MKKLHLVIAVLLIISSLYPASVRAEKNNNQQADQSIIFLPFTNYTGSDMNYLSGYLPELLKKCFYSDKNITPLDWNDVNENLKSDKPENTDLPDRRWFLQVMTSTGAGMGVTGRFLVQGETIIIETWLINSRGEYIPGTPFEGKIDDRFFKTLSDYAEDKVNWIRVDILHENIHKDIVEQQDIAYRFVTLLKEWGLSSMNKGWFLALIIMVIFYFVSMTASIVLIKIAEKFSSKTDTGIDDRVIGLARKPPKFIIILLGLRVALFASDIKSAAAVFAGKVILSLIFVVVAYIASGIFGIFIRSWGDRLADKINPRVNNDLVPLFERTMKVIVFSVVLMLILSSFDIDVAPLIASLGIAGFAIGFAVKDTLSNIIGGIILILDNSFSVGDKVTIDTDTGFIKEVGLRNTKILTYDNELIIIPNGELMNKKFKNYVLPDPTLRVVVNFDVAYGTDVDRVRELVLAAVKSMEGLCAEPAPVVEFTRMADFSLNFIAKFWIPDFSKYNDKMLEATDLIYKTLTSSGIEIPFPTNTVYLKKE
ncbi:MAG TPA: mechanosensitive ion channel family protein [Spirochaetota bacterium]|nr:mechanosensitive ion channel family protein [Spirochaetota bacterium]